MFDLRNFREEVLKLTQKELADLIDERQDKISRLEKNPVSIGLDILVKIADKTGTTLDELVHYKKMMPNALKIDDTWNVVEQVRKNVNDYIRNTVDHKITGNKHLLKVNEVGMFTEMSLRKPKIAIVGLSDTGKSTLINSLLGTEKMPAAWTPTTAISIYIKHMNDRPSYIEDDVWFFKAQVGNGSGWDSNRLKDERYTKEFLLKKGHIQDLKEFAVRRDIEDKTIGSAVVFIDSPILKVCDIIDLPGYNTGDRKLDTILTEQVRDYADIMIYMSLANGFMRGNDIEYLKSDLNYLPLIENVGNNQRPLANLFVVASQAHVVNKGNHIDLEKILDEGAKRLYTQIPVEFFEQRSKLTNKNYSMKSLRARFFTYSKDIDEIREPFEVELTEMIEGYPKLLIEQYKLALKSVCEINKLKIDQEIKGNQEISDKRDEYVKLVRNIDNKVASISQESEKLEKDIINRIQKLRTISRSDFRIAYHQLISIESIIDIIDQEEYTNVKGNMEKLGSLLNSKLQEKMRAVMEVRSLEFAKEVDAFINNFDVLVNDISDAQQAELKYKYTSKAAFVKGFSQCKNIGANAAWTSRLSDLGEYAMLGDGVNVLSALLYSVPGVPEQTHSPVGGVANGLAMSGIIGLGIGLALLAITSGMSIFGSGWKKSVAKKIVAAYENEKAFQAYATVMDGYFQETEDAFSYATNYLNKDFQENIAELKLKVIKFDTNQIDLSNKMEHKILDFYNGVENILLLH